MKTILCICSLVLISLNLGFGQTDKEDLEKYWTYRDRFLGEDGRGGFISIGPDQGQSLPASSRDKSRDCLRDWALIQSKTERHEGNGILRWGDGTVHLGYYLAMLAMEYRNLKDANAGTQAVIKELYYALKAYERLDTLAEVTLGMKANLNGFFLRDDVPIDFYVDETQPSGFRFMDYEKGGYECVGSDFNKGNRAVDHATYVSQDQVTSLLFGFAFVKKFAGDVVYKDESKEKFGDLAMLYSHLVVSYMKESKWKLKSPDGQKIPARWGGDARAFNSLFAAGAKKITEGKFDYKYNEKTFLGRMAKGSYGWAFGLHNRRNYSMIFRLMLVSDQWSSERMAKRGIKSGKIFYALADAVLNERKLDDALTKEDFESMIKSAPINGICFGTQDCDAPDGWKSSHLWFHTNHKNGNPYGQTYEYPGIDFMLLYNLFYYYYKDEMPAFKNAVIPLKNRKKLKIQEDDLKRKKVKKKSSNG